jgi:hypothetical protein
MNHVRRNGRSVKIRNIFLNKRYKDREGNCRIANSFGVNELPKIALLATKAYDYLTAKEEGE